MKKLTLFLVILIFFVPLVLSGQIDTIHTVGGWKATGTKGNVLKAGARVVTDTAYHGNHSTSFFGTLDDGASITYEKKYSTPLQNVSERDAEIYIFAKKMKVSGYMYIFVSFGNETGYSDPFVALIVAGEYQGFFYPFNFGTPKNPKDATKIKLEFVSHGTNEFEIFLDYFFLYGTVAYPRLVVEDFEDTTVPVRDESTLPNSFKLFQNYPNPFNPSTVISYQLSVTSNVKITIYNALGQEVAVLVNEEKIPGEYEIQFNGSNLSSGTYFYVLRAGNFSETKKMLLIK